MKRSRVHIGIETQPFRDMNVDAVRGAIRAMMETGATFAKALWYQRAQDRQIRRSGAYLQGIDDAIPELVSERIDDASVEVVYRVTNRAPHAAVIENGHAAFSLARSINWSGPNVKRGPSGPYLHIPFAHSAYQSASEQQASGITAATRKSMMPHEVYAQARRLRYTTPQRAGRQVSPTGQFLAADRYSRPGARGRLGEPMRGPDPPGSGLANQRAGVGDAWRGARIVRQGIATGRGHVGGRPLVNPAWGSSRFAGMIRTGTKGHTKYLTIRTITPRSLGWNIPAQPGHGIAREVAASLSGNGIGAARFRRMLVDAARAAMFGGSP